MQAAEMMRGTRAVYDLVLLISLSIAYVHSFPLQVLPSIPGYIPVYIRYGDQPLEEVNPALAEAFHEAPSLSKTPDLDSISNSPDIDLDEDEANEYNAYSVHAREISNRFATKDEEKQPIEESAETKASESIANAKKGRRREKHRRKMRPNPVVKVNPLTDEEKEALEKLQIEVQEDIKSINNMQESSSNLSELPSDKSPHKDNEDATDPVIKVGDIIIDESEDQPRAKNENPPTSLLTNEKVPIKEQPVSNALSNVHKISPSPEILAKLEEERKAKESLEETSK